MVLHYKTKGMDVTLSQIKCMQINLQRSWIATANLMKTNEANSTDIICIQEPNTIQRKVVGI